MSFILDSIKKAERERKLGQEAPSISIEYTSEHVDPRRDQWQQWAWLSLGLIITAIVVWATTKHFANRDHENAQLVTKTQAKETEEIVLEVETFNSDKQDIVMVPMKRVHQSDLKTVKVITEEGRIYQPQVETVVAETKVDNNISIEQETPKVNKTVKDIEKVKKSKPLYEFKPIVVKESNKQAAKQEIAALYSDLAKLAPINEPVHEVSEPIVEIEPANYVVEEKAMPKTNLSHVAPKTAVSTGLPSFGELPYDIQEQIPNFNISVHMFHADPNQRRIRINGSMYTEGKKLQQDLALVEITRYGAVFDYQGHLFRYNVR